MKEYKVVVMQVSSIDMKVMARSDKEAERKVKDIQAPVIKTYHRYFFLPKTLTVSILRLYFYRIH